MEKFNDVAPVIRSMVHDVLYALAVYDFPKYDNPITAMQVLSFIIPLSYFKI
jgi:hypothetical protein